MPATGSGRSPAGNGCWWPTRWIVEELNQFLRGWAGYFRYGNSARVLGQIRQLRPGTARAVVRVQARQPPPWLGMGL